MCFSATASFTTAVTLIPVGIYCINKSVHFQNKYWFFALLPLLLGVQQFFEGLIWLQMDSAENTSPRLAALGYLFFSHLFWLIWIPLSSYIVEKNPVKKRVMLTMTVIGTVLGLMMYAPLFFYNDWLIIELLNHSIDYDITLLSDEYVSKIVVSIIYALIIIVPLLISTDRYIKFFGVLIAISYAIETIFIGYAFISIWCFFSAILSFYILVMINQMQKNIQATEQ